MFVGKHTAWSDIVNSAMTIDQEVSLIMAQRNPMNERYLGDGPGGKTKKSASSLKPKSTAAASVNIEKRPETAKERKAAQRRRDAEKRRKEEAHAKRIAERELQARIDAGLEIQEEEKKKGFLGSLLPPRKTSKPSESEDTESALNSASGASTDTKRSAGSKSGVDTKAAVSSKTGTPPKEAASSSTDPSQKAKQPEEVRKLRRIYWGLFIVAAMAIAVSLYLQINNLGNDIQWYIAMGVGYVCAIGAVVFDIVKIRPTARKYQLQAESAKKSPKQLKHEQEAAANARELQRIRDAEKATKRSKRRRVSDADAAEETEAKEEEENPAEKEVCDEEVNIEEVCDEEAVTEATVTDAEAVVEEGQNS